MHFHLHGGCALAARSLHAEAEVERTPRTEPAKVHPRQGPVRFYPARHRDADGLAAEVGETRAMRDGFFRSPPAPLDLRRRSPHDPFAPQRAVQSPPRPTPHAMRRGPLRDAFDGILDQLRTRFRFAKFARLRRPQCRPRRVGWIDALDLGLSLLKVCRGAVPQPGRAGPESAESRGSRSRNATRGARCPARSERGPLPGSARSRDREPHRKLRTRQPHANRRAGIGGSVRRVEGDARDVWSRSSRASGQ